MSARRAIKGFTLIEALVVIAIAAILLAVGVPSFTYMIDRNRVSGEVNEMLADVALTRSEALARRGRVIICRSSAPTSATASCDGAATDWDTGWIVFIDDTTTGVAFQRDPAEPVIRAYLRTSPQVTISAAPAFAGLTVTSDGTVFVLDGNPLSSLGAGAEPLRIDFAGNDPGNSRSICIATTGRARISTTFGACA
ncbi:MAG TPA: GspH/FimT family pseudopilin [Burkholderiaceae bacterium]|nr:GspH/FimT family pseudopilin [Burkholderiaceae bacterium]